jgi:hypothetical protein
MAKSSEYPDLEWIPPKSYTNDDRTKADIKWIVIHDTEGSAHGTSAEDGARYNQKRTDGTSAHYFVDDNSVVQGVKTQDRAHTARSTGNRYGIQYELCAKANWSKAKWLDSSYGLPMLERAAKQCARDADKYDIPVVHLSVAEVRDKKRGFCGHADITKAFPADKGSHTDPGPNFPWTEFLNMVRKNLAPNQAVEDDMPAEAEFKAWVVEAIRNAKTLSDTDVMRIGAEVTKRLNASLVAIRAEVTELASEFDDYGRDHGRLCDPRAAGLH